MFCRIFKNLSLNKIRICNLELLVYQKKESKALLFNHLFIKQGPEGGTRSLFPGPPDMWGGGDGVENEQVVRGPYVLETQAIQGLFQQQHTSQLRKIQCLQHFLWEYVCWKSKYV